MREDIGRTIRQIRTDKVILAKDLCQNILTPQQLSNIENGKQTTSSENFILLLSGLNMKYDEFIYLMDNEYLNSKITIEKELSEYVKRQNLDGLIELAKTASDLFVKYGDVYFEHIKSMSLAMAHFYQTNFEYQIASEHLTPIEEYLAKVQKFSYYEITLTGQCLFMFNIEMVISFGEKALNALETRYSLYKNKGDNCVLLTNMSICCLDYKEYWHLALKYSQLSINAAATSNDATRAIHAQIIHQVACFKLKNGLFDKRYLRALIQTFKLIKWENEYKQVIKFIKNHGISIESLS